MTTHIALIKGSAIKYYWYIARNLKIAFRSSQQRHDSLWDILFPKKEWLSIASEMGLIPALVGYGVSKCYHGSCKPAYIVLVTGDYSGDLREQRKLLLDCLKLDNKMRWFNRKTHEVVLEEFNITLNIEDAYLSPENIRIDPTKLFAQNRVDSAALFWSDYNLRKIGPDDVVGIGGRALDLESLTSWCAIELTHPKMRVIEGARWNQSFENPHRPLNVTPIGRTARFIEGWNLAD